MEGLGQRVQTDETGLTAAARTETEPTAWETPASTAWQDSSPGGLGSRLAAGVARGALLIAVLTALSRLLGLFRTVVFAQSVGAGCLGTAYVTANQVPNLIYELALGGALATAMVPVLARSAARADSDPAERRYITQVSSALLTWSVLILVPVTAAIMIAARPIAAMLIPVNPNAACPRPAMISATTDMVVAFAPQILLYGISVVLTGLLTAYRKFGWQNLAPIIGNVIVIGAYLAFALLDQDLPIGRTPLAAQLVLSIGTTMNIAMLVLVCLPPTIALRLRLRPSLRLPPGVLRQAGGLALVGLIEFIASDLQSVVSINLANGHGDTGAVVLSNYTMLVFTSLCSVLPIAVVLSIYPVLAASEGEQFDQTSAGSTRAVMLMAWLSSAVMVALAVPAARVLASEPDQVDQLVEGFLLYAPGVAGFSIATNMSRVLFAINRLWAAGIGLTAGPLLQAGLSVALIRVVPSHLVVAALAASSTIAMTVVAVPMVLIVRRYRSPAAIAGVGHATFAGIAACVASSVVGVGFNVLVPDGGKVVETVIGAVATGLAVLVFGVVAFALAGSDMRTAAARFPLHRFARVPAVLALLALRRGRRVAAHRRRRFARIRTYRGRRGR